MLTLLALAAPTARADAPPGAPTLAVVGLHQASLDEADQERAVQALVQAVEAGGRFDARDVSEVSRALQGRENVVLEEGLVKSARQNLANGRTSAAQAAWDEARSWLDAAVRDYERTMPGSNHPEELWEAFVLLGATWLQQDTPDEAAARAAFARAIALNPQRPADPAQYPPNVTDVFSAVQSERVAQSATAAFEGAGKLWVDGVERGVAPVTVGNLVPGTHFALARGDGRQGFARFDVPSPAPADPVSVVLPMGPPSLGAGGDIPLVRATEIGALYGALAKRADGLQYVLVGGVDGPVLYLQLYDVVHGVVSKAVELPYADDCDDEAVAAIPLLLPVVDATGAFTATAPNPAPLSLADNVLLARLLTQPPAYSTELPPPPPPPHKSRLPLVLGLVGGAVVAGGATTAVVLLAKGPPPPTGTVILQF